ncbi:MAG: hypothetical protein HZA05_00695 [Nitrospirae bacterium]|nr:hypothetical protein [Nitrospirota bacterium]
MKFFKIIILYTIIIYALLTSRSAIGNEVKLSEHEAYVLLDKLLTLSEKSSNQKVELDRSLERYKEWVKVYPKFSGNEEITKNKMKIYLFMVFIAHEKVMIDDQEEIAEEIMSIFTRQPEMMLSVLKELPFLMPSTCTSLNDHFDLFDRKEQKQQFIKKYEGNILKSLGKEQAGICLNKLRNQNFLK